MKKETDIYAGYSPDVAEILGKRPRWIIRNGTILLALIFAAGLVGTWFIPYPESVNCSMEAVYDGMISKDSVAAFGSSVIPVEYATTVQPGMLVSITILPQEGATPVRVKGIVKEVAFQPAARNCQVTIAMLLRVNEAQTMMNATAVRARIITRESTLLNKIFDPVISIVRGSGKNSQAKGRP